MKFKPVSLIVLAVLIVSLSCISTSNVSTNSGQTQAPILSSPFAAEATSPMSVQLDWKPVAGAQKYLLAVRLGDSEFIPVAELPGDKTSYENFPVLPGSELTYRLQSVTSSGTNDAGTVTATTPESEPNPLTVQANDYKPIEWTPPTQDPLNPITDPSKLLPPGFDPNDPNSFDPSQFLQMVAASADIGADGGEITVTTPDNITYTLAVPAGALDDVNTITLVPIQSIDSLPFSGGLQGAVRIEPEGLTFDIPAALTITRADSTPLPDGMLKLAFTFEGPGHEFHLQPFGLADANTFNPGAPHLAIIAAKPRLSGPDGGISVSDSQSYGAAVGTREEARGVIQQNAPTDSHSNIQNILAYAQQEADDLAPLPTKTQLAQGILVKGQNGVTWDDMKKSLDQLDNFQKTFGKDPNMKGKIDEIWDALLEKLNKMLQYNKEKCLTRDDFDAHALASNMTKPKKGSFNEQMATRFKKKYGDSVLKQVEDTTKSCILDLKINSQITADTPPVKFIVQVNGTISNLKFNFSKGKTFLSGDGVLHYAPIQVIPNGNTPRDFCDPWVPLNDITATVKITRLEPIFYPRTADSEGGALKDFKLSFIVSDNGRPSFKETCTSIDKSGKVQKSTINPSLNYGKGSIWGGVFTASHMAELQTGGIFGWEILYDEHLDKNSTETDEGNHPIYARNIIDNPSFSPGYGNWAEHTEFVLINNK